MHCTQKIRITALAKLGKSESDGDRILSKGELLQEGHKIIAVTINIKINLPYFFIITVPVAAPGGGEPGERSPPPPETPENLQRIGNSQRLSQQ